MNADRLFRTLSQGQLDRAHDVFCQAADIANCDLFRTNRLLRVIVLDTPVYWQSEVDEQRAIVDGPLAVLRVCDLVEDTEQVIFVFVTYARSRKIRPTYEIAGHGTSFGFGREHRWWTVVNTGKKLACPSDLLGLSTAANA